MAKLQTNPQILEHIFDEKLRIVIDSSGPTFISLLPSVFSAIVAVLAAFFAYRATRSSNLLLHKVEKEKLATLARLDVITALVDVLRYRQMPIELEAKLHSKTAYLDLILDTNSFDSHSKLIIHMRNFEEYPEKRPWFEEFQTLAKVIIGEMR